ncbi:MAG: hypothetical protein IPH08_05290 [Rhodocyclaceae bacterium]|nr:hypothetical protein [Rhodocyclaceae bacterium]
MTDANPTVLPRDSEDSYLASLSDLIIGVLFIFIILLMAFALNYRVAQTEADVRQKEAEERNRQLSDAQMDRKELLENVQKTLREKGIQVEIDTLNGVLRFRNRFYLIPAKPSSAIQVGRSTHRRRKSFASSPVLCQRKYDGR